MIGPQLTEAMLNKFTSVIDLQNYILEYSVQSAQIEQEHARKELIYAILILLVFIIHHFAHDDLCKKMGL